MKIQEPILPDHMLDEAQDASKDRHADILLELARQLGVGNDFYYPLLGSANKLDMYRCGQTYEAAVKKEG